MAGKTASIAKITRPVLAGSYLRKRLFRLIDRSRKKKVVWVTGPPGSGKTTLVSSYIADRRFPCLWIRLEEGDADPATFFHYLGLAAKKAAPRVRKPLPVLTPDQRPAVTVFAQRYFESLFSRLKSSSVIVFDDYQKVLANSAFHTMVRDGLSLLPPSICVILISREQPPSMFARLRASQSLEVIGWKELRLSPRETEGIARLRWKGKGSKETIRNLHGISDGWAAGCVLLLERARSGSGAPLKLPRHKPQEILDYFAGEILENLDEEMHSFLLKSAHLPRMTAKMAAQLTGLRRAGQILFYMNRHNYFTEVHPGPESVYEYHPLFRDFLRSRSSDLFTEKYIRRVRGRAAAILEQSGHVEEAAGTLREIGDWHGFSRVLRKQAPALVRQGRSGKLAEWLEFLPGEILEEDPWLLYWRGVARLSTLPGESQGDFEEAFRRFSRQKERDGAFLAWAGVVDAIIYGPGSMKTLDPWFLTLGKMWKKTTPSLPEEIESQATCAMIKALSLRRPPFVDMGMWADRAMRLAQKTRDVPLTFTSLLNVAYYRFHSGDFQEAGLLLDSLRELGRRPEISPLSRLTLCWLEAAYANVNGMYDRCRKVVAEGIELADATGVHHMDILLKGHGALSSLHGGDLETAAGFLRKMASRLSAARPWEESFYHRIAAWEALYRGDRAQALFHSDRCLTRCEEVGNPWTEALALVLRAFVLQEGEKEGEAARHLRRAHRMGKESGMHFIRFVCLLAEAFFSLLQGDEASGLSSLREGLRIGREKGYISVYLWCPGLLETVTAKALEKGIETGYVRDLIRRNALVPDAALPGLESWPWPLKLNTLGTFGLLKEEKPLSFTRKVQHKPLLMLKVLVALGGRDVPEEQMTDILWPEAEGDLAHQSFATTLRRLRKLLGNEKAVSLREGRVTLDARHCWVDAFAFESLLARVDADARSSEVYSDGANAAYLAEKAIALYRGPFLAAEASHPWAVGVGERMRSKFLRAVGFLGRFLEGEGRWAEAVACYRRGLEVDDLAEEFYQRLMICHQRNGQVAEALAVYNRCSKTLSAVLGVAPSADTEAIADRIRPA
jgi:ATP/maltotriose-dependent transcriptional regulator MalT/DNA-binding SARP family transcriptional activator